MNVKLTITIGSFIAGFLFWNFFFRAGNTVDFVAAYQAYDAVSGVEEAVAHVPGDGNNVARQKLNGILSRVLTEDMTPAERQALSWEGIALADEIREQIDTIATEGVKTKDALETMRKAAKEIHRFSTRREASHIVLLAEERARIIKVLTETSYGVNGQLENIFRGIISDGGALTSERINTLNSGLPEAEEQFDLLTENYRKLSEVEGRIDVAFAALQKNGG